MPVPHPKGLLETAGFEDVSLDPMDEPILLAGGGSLEDAVRFVLEFGPAAALLADVDDEVRAAAAESVREVLTPHLTDAGVSIAGAAWIVSGRRSG